MVTWVIEKGVFLESGRALERAVVDAGHQVVAWEDRWWSDQAWPDLSSGPVVFRGCLENAARVARAIPWAPGSFCNVEEFFCSNWYPDAESWLLHDEWKLTTVRELSADAQSVLASTRIAGSVFVRPDSPLKPFSGRVLPVESVSLKSLDHGFYYDDLDLPIIVAPVRAVTREWRYIIAAQRVVAGSAYEADGRNPKPDDPRGEPWQFAQSVAGSLSAPESVYVADVCEADGELRLLELNPFSGADLYACNSAEIVAAVSNLATDLWGVER